MVLYKLRKLFREKGMEILKMTLALSFACAGSFLIALPILMADDMDRKEKLQMCGTFLVAGIISALTLLYMDTFNINIILKIFGSILISFCIFVPIIFSITTYTEYKSVTLDRSEERDAKLLGILKNGRKSNN